MQPHVCDSSLERVVSGLNLFFYGIFCLCFFGQMTINLDDDENEDILGKI